MALEVETSGTQRGSKTEGYSRRVASGVRGSRGHGGLVNRCGHHMQQPQQRGEARRCGNKSRQGSVGRLVHGSRVIHQCCPENCWDLIQSLQERLETSVRIP